MDYDKKQKEENDKNIAIDFDGVIHNSSKGFHDGTIYGEPIKGSLEAIKSLAEKYNIIIFTCKAKSDRPLINDKTGTELIEEWLEKHGVRKYVSEITSDKPRAAFYIDDKAIRFNNWKNTLKEIE